MYPIYNVKQQYRLRSQHIIITHCRNLHSTNLPLKPELKIGTYAYSWGLWQRYFREEVKNKLLPMHYFVEQLGQDYVIYVGCNFVQQSWYIKELVDNNIIPYQYRDAILVVLQEDFSRDIPDGRMYDHLNDKLISGLMKEHSIDFTRILTLDEILVEDWEDRLHQANMKYDIKPMIFFDKDRYNFALKEYLKR